MESRNKGISMDDGILEAVKWFVQTVGFPSAVVAWLLIRSDRLQREHTKTLTSLENTINRLIDTLPGRS